MGYVGPSKMERPTTNVIGKKRMLPMILCSDKKNTAKFATDFFLVKKKEKKRFLIFLNYIKFEIGEGHGR